MPIMCTVQMPEGRSRDEINQVMADVSKALMEDLHTGEREVRVTIVELPRNRFMAGGIRLRNAGFPAPWHRPGLNFRTSLLAAQHQALTAPLSGQRACCKITQQAQFLSS